MSLADYINGLVGRLWGDRQHVAVTVESLEPKGDVVSVVAFGVGFTIGPCSFQRKSFGRPPEDVDNWWSVERWLRDADDRLVSDGGLEAFCEPTQDLAVRGVMCQLFVAQLDSEVAAMTTEGKGLE